MIIFRRDRYPFDYVELSSRELSGDLQVINRGKHFEVDQSDEWLFPWEREQPKCYARRMQQKRFLEKGRCVL